VVQWNASYPCSEFLLKNELLKICLKVRCYCFALLIKIVLMGRSVILNMAQLQLPQLTLYQAWRKWAIRVMTLTLRSKARLNSAILQGINQKICTAISLYLLEARHTKMLTVHISLWKYQNINDTECHTLLKLRNAMEQQNTIFQWQLYVPVCWASTSYLPFKKIRIRLGLKVLYLKA